MVVYRALRGATTVSTSDPIPIDGVNVTLFLELLFGTTVTLALEGSFDGLNWERIVIIDDNDITQAKVLTKTYTVGAVQSLAKANNSYYPFYRVNITAITGVTVDAWIGGSTYS